LGSIRDGKYRDQLSNYQLLLHGGGYLGVTLMNNFTTLIFIIDFASLVKFFMFCMCSYTFFLRRGWWKHKANAYIRSVYISVRKCHLGNI